MGEENRRRRTRVPIQARVDVQATGALVRDLASRDLSHKGVFVLGHPPLEPGQECYVTIHLFGAGEDVPDLEMEGKVVRVNEQGAAIDFVSMGPETYLHLRNLVLLNSDDPERTEREFATPVFDPQSEID